MLYKCLLACLIHAYTVYEVGGIELVHPFTWLDLALYGDRIRHRDLTAQAVLIASLSPHQPGANTVSEQVCNLTLLVSDVAPHLAPSRSVAALSQSGLSDRVCASRVQCASFKPLDQCLGRRESKVACPVSIYACVRACMLRCMKGVCWRGGGSKRPLLVGESRKKVSCVGGGALSAFISD